jgi:hypothetical protein
MTVRAPSSRWVGALLAVAVFSAGVVASAVGAIAAIVCAVATFAFARLLLDRDERPLLLPWVMTALALRIAFAAGLHAILVQRGPLGNLFLDDAGYVRLGIDIADYWLGRGPAPFIDPSFDHNYIKAAGAVFALAGPNVLALKLLNTFFGVTSAVIVFRIARAAGLPGSRVALGIALVFPSLVLWSALALKDSFSNFFCLLAVWGVTAFAQTRRLRWFALTVFALALLENVRAFLFVILATAWPAGLLIALPSRRAVPVAAATATAALMLVSTSALNYLDPNIITASVYIRQAMAQRAASGFVVPLPVIRAEACTLFVVTVPGRTPVPGAARQIDVPVGVELVVDTPGATAQPGQLLVRPGDLVAVAGATPCPVAAAPTPTPTRRPRPPGSEESPEPTPTPAPTLRAVIVVANARNIVSTPAPTTQDNVTFASDAIELVRHLPIGIGALLLAPFPPLARGPGELATTPEMLAWYALLVLAALGARHLGAEPRARLAYALIVAAIVALVLVLYEGNLGTLVRHRAMVIPFVILLAGVGVAHLRRPPRD